jgi:hypothetical protein
MWSGKKHLSEIPFIIFLSFILTFICTRLYLFLSSHDVMELPGAVIFSGTHIHHFSFGILLLAVVGYLAILDIRPALHRRLAIIYGIGLGLTFDEFGMWLKLTDNYYSRITYDAIIIVSLILLNLAYFPGFWSRMGRNIIKHLPLKHLKFPDHLSR